MILRRISLYISILLLTSTLIALDPEKEIDQYKHKVWQYEEGLPQNTITCITQTDDGYLWFGTREGIIRFDGIKFEQFDSKNIPLMTNDEIWDIFSDSKGNLWIGTADGLILYSNNIFKKYVYEDGLADNNIWNISEDSKGNIWIGTGGGGLSVFDGKQFKTYTVDTGFPSNYVWCTFEDSKGNIWVGTDGDGLLIDKGNGFIQVSELYDFDLEYVFDITEDSNGNLYFATPDGLLTNIDNQFDLLGHPEGITHNFLWTVKCDKDDNIWIGTEGGGLIRFNQLGISTFREMDGLSSNVISYIYEDAEDNIWIATKGGGINRLKDKIFKSLLASRNELSSNLTYCVYEEPEGTIWVGTNNGLNKIEDGKTEVFAEESDISSLIVTSITSDAAGNIWIGTDGNGINKFANNQFELITTENGLSGNSVWSLFIDNKENLWIGTNGGGINKIVDGVVQVIGEDKFQSEFVSDFHQDYKDNIWISTLDNGLFIYDGMDFNKVKGLDNFSIWSIYEDSDSTIWITTVDGLRRFLNDSTYTYRESDGLFDETIYSMIEYTPGDYWFSSDEGIFRINKTDFDLFDKGKINQLPCATFGIEEGMESAECSEGNPSIIKTSEGLLYFATIKGVTIVDPQNIKRRKHTLPVLIEAIVADGSSYDPNLDISLPAGTERIEFNFTAFYYSSPTRVQFQYMLEKFDKDWIKAGTKRSATYTKLPPGNYTFKVRASFNNDWNNVITTASFSKAYFLWETKTFQAFVLLIIIAFPFAFYSYRLKRSKKKSELLEKIIKERTIHLRNEIDERRKNEIELNQTKEQLEESLETKDKFFAIISHDLRSPFQGLLGFSDLLSTELDSFTKEEIEDITKSIHKLSKNFITLLNNLLEWSRIQQGTLEIKKENVNVEFIVKNIAVNLSSSLATKNLKLVLEIDPELEAYTDENILYSAILNLTMNAIKFSHKGETIVIGAKESENMVEVFVQDFGIGISDELKQKLFKINSKIIRHGTNNELGSGLGLVLCNDLIKAQGGKISVESEEGEGTTFKIQLPKKTN